MPSYVITGVSRGLGWEFLTQTSNDPNNTVIGVVRNKASADRRVAEELSNRSNITILEADITKYGDLKNVATKTAEITGGTLDYLISNAAMTETWDGFDSIGTLAEDHELFDKYFHKAMDTNVLANVHLFNLFMPLILKGQTKKVIAVSSGHADPEAVREFDINVCPVYAATKSALNMVVAKFSAQYRKDGVLVLAVSPGIADVGSYSNITPEQAASLADLAVKFQKYAPNFKGPAAPKDAIKAVLSVIEKASVANGNGGDFLSHFGNKQWL